MEIEKSQTTKPTLKRKHRKPNTGNAVHESLSKKTKRRVDSSQCCINKNSSSSHQQVPKDVKCGGEEEAEEEDREEVEKKIEALQRIVPGGESLGVDKLFEETAGYIMALQGQLKAMKTLARIVEGLEKEKNRFGA